MAAEAKTQSELYLWPYEEAKKVADRVARYESGRPVIFQSGFGPSGMPHLGTMSEVLRPSYVRKAFEQLKRSGVIPADRPTRLIVFIDDMDGLRKVPERISRIARAPAFTWGNRFREFRILSAIVIHHSRNTC